MFFASRARLRRAVMANDSLIYFDAPRFAPNKTRRFPVTGSVDHGGLLLGSLPLGHNKYFESKQLGIYSVGDLVRVRCRWV